MRDELEKLTKACLRRGLIKEANILESIMETIGLGPKEPELMLCPVCDPTSPNKDCSICSGTGIPKKHETNEAIEDFLKTLISKK